MAAQGAAEHGAESGPAVDRDEGRARQSECEKAQRQYGAGIGQHKSRHSGDGKNNYFDVNELEQHARQKSVVGGGRFFTAGSAGQRLPGHPEDVCGAESQHVRLSGGDIIQQRGAEQSRQQLHGEEAAEDPQAVAQRGAEAVAAGVGHRGDVVRPGREGGDKDITEKGEPVHGDRSFGKGIKGKGRGFSASALELYPFADENHRSMRAPIETMWASQPRVKASS